ncbi:MAG TPA: pyrrolo-quinoline quinone, partial [Rhodospirillales bacterium]|nr:pyrrolo-quinoline quinone [Rhodospirillales bacterium]
GSVLWHRPLLAPILAPPTVSGELVFVVTADNRLLAMNRSDGTPVWQHAGLFEQAGILGGAPVATDGRTVVVAYSSGEVFALRFRDGRVIWSDSVLRPRRTLALGAISDITGAPVIDGDRVYVVGNGGEMAAFALDRGNRFWDSDLTSRETPWIAGEFIYLLTDRNEIVCLLRRGGRVRWVSPFARLADPEDPASARIIWSAPVLAGDRLVVAGSTAEAVSVSPYTGEVLGRIGLPAPVRIAPVIVDATLLFLTENGDLLAYR